MPSYTVVSQRMSSYGQASALLPKLRQIYQQCQEVSTSITLYQAGSNADFNTAINSIFSAAERAELAAMLNDVQTLVSAWTSQHAALLAPPP